MASAKYISLLSCSQVSKKQLNQCEIQMDQCIYYSSLNVILWV